jgi:hypothetical protein
MKKLMLAAVICATTVIAGAQRHDRADDVLRLNERVSMMLERNIYRMSPREQDQVFRKLEEIRDIVRGGQSGPQGSISFCSAACTDPWGAIIEKNSRGAFAEFEQEAKQLALDEVNNNFRCSNGAKVMACDKTSFEVFGAVATCTDPWGAHETKSSRYGTGRSQEAAKQNARENVMAKYKCSNSTKIQSIGSDRTGRHYCSAACTDPWGSVDSTKTKGAGGDSLIEATGKALEAVIDAHRCSNGAKIVNCSK